MTVNIPCNWLGSPNMQESHLMLSTRETSYPNLAYQHTFVRWVYLMPVVRFPYFGWTPESDRLPLPQPDCFYFWGWSLSASLTFWIVFLAFGAAAGYTIFLVWSCFRTSFTFSTSVCCFRIFGCLCFSLFDNSLWLLPNAVLSICILMSACGVLFLKRSVSNIHQTSTSLYIGVVITPAEC